jgi:4-diphosphocytidyl-2-C-methyl-D-erythritol kinase
MRSPAKLNLHLEVLGRRDDGFHELETLMTNVSLHDQIEFTEFDLVDGQLDLHCGWADGLQIQSEQLANLQQSRILGELPKGDQNVIARTVRVMRDLARADSQTTAVSREWLERHLQIDVVKRIPSGAGLGGASSNSATVILGLNRLWQLNWSRSRLAEIAASLGSDNAFFISGQSAICRGRGEIVEPISMPAGWDVVIVRPPESLATAKVFTALAESKAATRSHDLRSVDSIAQQAICGNRRELARNMFNRLQLVAATMCDWIYPLQDEFARAGCLGHQMTGSGTCYFGLCANRKNAMQLAHRLHQRRLGLVFACQTA